MRRASHKGHDIVRFHRLIDTLRRFPGDDEVHLRLSNNGKISRLRLPHIAVNYCPELHQQLVALAGEEGIRFEADV